MARKEKPLEGGPQHLAELAGQLRAVREGAGSPIYDKLSRKSNPHKSVATLSRAAGGQHMPTWETTEVFLRACGHQLGPKELDWWQQLWEKTNKMHVASKKERKEQTAGRSAVAVPVTPVAPAPVPEVSATEPLARQLWKVTSRAELAEAIWLLARRNGCDSLRPLEERTGIARTTLSGWFRGERRPPDSRFLDLILALEATPLEIKAFVEALHRVWAGKPPELISRYVDAVDEDLYQLVMVLSGRNVLGGRIRLTRSPSDVLGISVGGAEPADEIEFGAISMGTVITVDIWCKAGAGVGGREFHVRADLDTTEAEWETDFVTFFPFAYIGDDDPQPALAIAEAAEDIETEDVEAVVDTLPLQPWSKQASVLGSVFVSSVRRSARSAGPSPFTPVRPPAASGVTSSSNGTDVEKPLIAEYSSIADVVRAAPEPATATPQTINDGPGRHRKNRGRHRKTRPVLGGLLG